MTHRGEEQAPVTSLDHVLDGFVDSVFTARDRDVVKAALVNREDQMRDVLHLAGQQFGLYPQIVAEVLAEVGLGTPPSETERAMIRRNFDDLMEAFRRAQAGEGPMPTP